MSTMMQRLLLSKILPILALSYVFIGENGCKCTDVGFSATNYPQAKRDENVSDTYPGNTIVKDPYQWLEKIDSDATKKFIETENAVSRAYLDQAPYRTELATRYKELWPFKSLYAFFQRGNKFFSFQNDGSVSQTQDVIYVQDSFNGAPRVLLDPNTLSKDGSILLDNTYSSISDDGMIFAYVLGTGDSGWNMVKFLHVEKGNIYQETLTRVRNSLITFNGDFKGIFYSGYLDYKGKLDDSDTTPLKNHKLYYHILGTDQSQDIIVAEFSDKPDSIISGWVTGEGKNLVIFLTVNSENINTFVYIADLAKINHKIEGKLELIPVVTEDEGQYLIAGNFDTTFIFKTNANAPNWKLISFDIVDIKNTWKDLVPQDEKNTLEFAIACYEKYMVLCYTVDVKSVLQLHDQTSGKMLHRFNLEIGTVDSSGFFGDTPYKDFYFSLQSFTGFTGFSIIYHCDLTKSFELDIFHEPEVKNFNRKNFVTEQVFFKSKDGTSIPMFITHKKDLQKNGNNPVIMDNNDGDGHSPKYFFRANRLMFLSNLNGVYVVVNNRGGGEYGEKWHEAGMLHNKQNIFDDMHAAAEYLIAQKYTSPKLMTMYGGAHGGMIIGACINQRPDLYGVAVIDSGLFDILRFDKYPGGDEWVPEIGSPNNAADFPYIFKYSPLHHISIPESADKQYPAIMLNIGVEDYIPPAHSLKHIATLQFEATRHSNQKNPFIITINTMTTNQSENMDNQAALDSDIARFVDMYSFIIQNTGIKFQPSGSKDD